LRGTDCGSAISLHVVEESLPEREGFVGTSAFVLYKLQILRGRRDPFCYERWGALPGIARWRRVRMEVRRQLERSRPLGLASWVPSTQSETGVEFCARKVPSWLTYRPSTGCSAVGLA